MESLKEANKYIQKGSSTSAGLAVGNVAYRHGHLDQLKRWTYCTEMRCEMHEKRLLPFLEGV